MSRWQSYIGGLDEQEAPGTTDVPATKESTTAGKDTVSSKNLNENDEPKPQEEGSDVSMKDDRDIQDVSSCVKDSGKEP